MINAAALPQPGSIWGPYPENRARPDRLERFARRLRLPGIGRYRALATRSIAAGQALAHLDDTGLLDAARAARTQLAREGLSPDALARALALASEACRRELGLTPFLTQRMAAAIMLDNRLAEMATGEGKTLAAALAAATAALAGMPVHVLTANDYLVQRDADRLRAVYGRLGLSTGAVVQSMDSAARRAAYACDIAYCTARELVFDYLRDQTLRAHAPLADAARRLGGAQAPLLRGLCVAFVDEADSLLLDEAGVPFVLARAQDDSQDDTHTQAWLDLAAQCEPGQDFHLRDRDVILTAAGQARLAHTALASAFGTRRACTALRQALFAHHLLLRDRDYVVQDGTVQLVDATTGRVSPGRRWSQGLHRLVELKEGCPPGVDATPSAQITYPRFFPRYVRLGGMSGTLTESRRELRRLYGLDVVRVPLRAPSQRRTLGQTVYPTQAQLWQAVCAHASREAAAGRPVLIGVDSVADAARLSAVFAQAGQPHTLIDARHNRHEAAAVAAAGAPGRITVATQMAGRGTDIPLSPDALANGGLHVILCQLNSTRRIDRQFAGRAARQGDPGSVAILRTLDAALATRVLPPVLTRLAARCAGADGRLPRWLGPTLCHLAQWLDASRQQRQRLQLAFAEQQRTRSAAYQD